MTVKGYGRSVDDMKRWHPPLIQEPITGKGCGREFASWHRFSSHLSRCPSCDALRCTDRNGHGYRCMKWAGHGNWHKNLARYNRMKQWFT